jgi:hypothetical protein
MGASDLDIPGTMSLESVGVLKLQACSGQLISGQVRLFAAKRQRLYRRRFGGARSVLSTGASGIGVFGTVPSGSAGEVHLWT